MGKTTIEVSDERKEQLRKERLDHERNYDETIARLLGDYDGPIETEEIVEEIKNQLSMANEPGVEVDVEELFERLDRIEEQTQMPDTKELVTEIRALKKAVETVDGLGYEVSNEQVMNRIDDLETRLPSKVKEELR